MSDPRNNVAGPQRATLTAALDALYPHLAVLHSLPRRSAGSGSSAAHAGVQRSRPHNLGPVVLVWGVEDDDGAGTALGRPRRAPVEHPVRGHQRRLASGDVVWVRAHERGTGGTGPSLPRVYRVSRR